MPDSACALTLAAEGGQEEALLRAKANTTELHTNKGYYTTLLLAEAAGHRRAHLSAARIISHLASASSCVLWCRSPVASLGCCSRWCSARLLRSPSAALSRPGQTNTELLENNGTALRGTLKPG